MAGCPTDADVGTTRIICISRQLGASQLPKLRLRWWPLADQLHISRPPLTNYAANYTWVRWNTARQTALAGAGSGPKLLCIYSAARCDRHGLRRRWSRRLGWSSLNITGCCCRTWALRRPEHELRDAGVHRTMAWWWWFVSCPAVRILRGGGVEVTLTRWSELTERNWTVLFRYRLRPRGAGTTFKLVFYV